MTESDGVDGNPWSQNQDRVQLVGRVRVAAIDDKRRMESVLPDEWDLGLESRYGRRMVSVDAGDFSYLLDTQERSDEEFEQFIDELNEGAYHEVMRGYVDSDEGLDKVIPPADNTAGPSNMGPQINEDLDY